MTKRCRKCFYYKECEAIHPCNAYTPKYDLDKETNDYIESERRSFNSEWYEYIGEYSDNDPEWE